MKTLVATVINEDADAKVCPRCGARFEQRPGQRPSNWRQQTYCSPSCASRGDVQLPPNVTYRQFDYWASKGYIRPESEANPGTGHRRKLSSSEESVLRILADLAADGVQPAIAARVARDLVRTGRARLGSITITRRLGPNAQAS